jgi:DNA polymerase IV
MDRLCDRYEQIRDTPLCITDVCLATCRPDTWCRQGHGSAHGRDRHQAVGDIHGMHAQELEMRFGRWGMRLYQLARAIDQNPVVSNRVRKQISAEDTFPDDVSLTECEPHIRKLSEKVWTTSRDNLRGGRRVVLKLKKRKLSSLTRSLTPPVSPCSCNEFTEIATRLCERVDLGPQQL